MPAQYPVQAYYPAESSHPDFAGEPSACCVMGDHDSHAVIEDDRNYPDFAGQVLGAGPSEFSGASADFGNVGAWSPMGDAFSDFRDRYLVPAAKGAAATAAQDALANPDIQASIKSAATETVDQKIGKYVRTHAAAIGFGLLAVIGGAVYFAKRKKS